MRNRFFLTFSLVLAAFAVSVGVTHRISSPVKAQTSHGGTHYTAFRMAGQSMMPTLHNNQLVEIDRSAYRTHSPQRGDIVVFRAAPAGEPDRLFLKRIIGLPGETVAVHGGVYINGRLLAEPYVSVHAWYIFRRQRVPQHAYFVLGDNRNNSDDSHLWLWLPRQDIVGKVVHHR